MFTLSQWNWYKRSKRKGAFGDAVGVELTPIASLKATYGILGNAEAFSATGGSVTASSGQFICSSGTSVGGYGTLWTRQPVVYQPGLGCEARATAIFTPSPPALSTQLVGLFTGADGMFFGYNGEDFGIMHRYGGAFEIREIEITNPAGGAETVTVTLNGTGYAVPVTNSSAQENAHEIEVGLLASAAANEWNFQHVDDTVICQYKGVGAKSGSYSVSSTGSLTATIAQNAAGVTPTEDWVYQANWNNSKASWLDVTKGNLYKFEFAYLGHGPLNYYIMNAEREWELVHSIEWQNQQTVPNLGNPSLRVGWASASLGSSGTDLVVKGASAMSATQGKSSISRHFGASGLNGAISTEEHILSVEVRREFNGAACNAVVLPTVYASTDSTKGMIFRAYLNADVSGVDTHQYINRNESVCIYDNTVNMTVSGGSVIGDFVVGPNGSVNFDQKLIGNLTSGDKLTITGEVVSGASSGGYVTINTRELV